VAICPSHYLIICLLFRIGRPLARSALNNTPAVLREKTLGKEKQWLVLGA